ncbi:MAG: helix-turn-helix domain-containing protein [Clostridiales Family XIII bacterium]|jgi:excisionase family DNA binding protein|nr:helix-turn-helix domain-containing protein [Clostridiales Family XIII bacterium]
MSADIKFLTIDDVSEMLQVTRSTVYNLKKRGLPFIKLGKNIRFDQKEVVDWVKANREEKYDGGYEEELEWAKANEQ